MDGRLVTSSGSLGAGSLALLTTGDQIELTGTAEGPTDLAIVGGAPAEGPILFSGPFVMGTADELSMAKRSYATGKMGRLEGVPF